jgi:hypothetical protein
VVHLIILRIFLCKSVGVSHSQTGQEW